jgi:hypothetical protein
MYDSSFFLVNCVRLVYGEQMNFSLVIIACNRLEAGG